MKVVFPVWLALLGIQSLLSAGFGETVSPRRPPVCFYRWPNGAFIDDVRSVVTLPNGEKRFLKDDCNVEGRDDVNNADQDKYVDDASPEYYSGWVEFGGYLTERNITLMTASWTVPPPPPHYNIFTTVFLFAGLEEKSKGQGSTDILQPVLQYGHSGCGGGDHWSVASFFVAGITAHCGSVIRVKAGDRVYANMSYNEVDDSWTVTSIVNFLSGGEKKSILQVKAQHAYHWASVTLEGIRVYHCSGYPSGKATQFSNITLHEEGGSVNPHWTTTVDYHDCGQSAKVLNSRSVSLFYNATVNATTLL